MSGKTLALRVAFLKLLLHGTALANVWDNAASSPITSIYLSLHTADPGLGGNQTTSEASYTDYARVAITRDAGGWTIDDTTGIATPAAEILFPSATTAGGPYTYVGIGRDASGTGYLFMTGAISPAVYAVVGNQPKLTTASQISEA